MTIEVGTKLGPYEILSPLGAGGMGEVYRAKDNRLDREVAVKVLPEQFTSDAAALSRFEREGKAVAALSHPNVLAVYDVGRDGDKPYVVTELLEGETLRQRIKDGPLPWRKAVRIGTAVVDGLAAAHARGIVHRDLKPENIFLTTDGLVKILDFGLARIEQEQNEGDQDAAHTPTVTIETRPGTVVGTLNYMSPEQLRGLATDARSDIFAFGCVLYEMVAGRRAFRGETSADTMTAILRETPTSVRTEIADVGADLERVIERCLEKKADERFHSASDLGFTLKTILADSGTLAAANKTRRFWSHAVPVGATAVVILAAGAWLLSQLWAKAPPTDASFQELRSIAVLPFDNLSNDDAQQVYVDAIWESITDDLAKIGALQVTSSHTLRYYREQNTPMSAIEEKVDVDAYITGSALHAGSRVEIRVRLIRAEDGRQLWSNHYEFDKRDILTEQRKVARAVAREIQVELSPAEEDMLAAAPRIVPSAYDAYVRGMEKVHLLTPESIEEALDLFDQALAEDPDFALAYVGRARAFHRMASDFLSPHEAMPKCRKAAMKALEIDPTLADAHVVLGLYKLQYEWDWDGARDAFENALELSPSLAKAHLGYALYLTAMGRGKEALKRLNKVHELDRASLYTDFDHGAVSFMARDFERTIRDNQAALVIDSDWWGAHLWLAAAYSIRGEHDDAIRHALEVERIDPTPGNRAMTGGILAVAGRREEAKAIYDELKLLELEKEEYICPYELATIPLGLGDVDTTFYEMNRACEERADCLAWLDVDPRLDSIRDDSRFDDLLMRVGFEPKKNRLRLAEEDETPSIVLAVFPFNDNSPEPHAWLAAGLAQQISARLARVNSDKLRVIGSDSAASYAGSGKPLDEVAQSLKANFVLRGAIQTIDNDVRITASLIDPSDLTQSWSSTFKGTLDNSFSLQTQVAERIVSGLPCELTDAETQRLQKKYTTNPEAEIAYMKGRFWWHKHTKDGFQKAIQNFERAIQLDPSYALAYAGLADATATFTSWTARAAPAIKSKAMEAAQRALELDDSLAESHTSAGIVAQFLEWDWGAAEAAYRRAIQRNPDYYLAHHNLAHLLVMLGREGEAIAEFEMASLAEPISSFNRACFGGMLVSLGRIEDGERMLKRALSWNDEDGLALDMLGYAYQLQERFDEAIQVHERASNMQPEHPVYLAVLGSTYAAAGREDDARRVLVQLKELSGRTFVGQMEFARVYAALGEKDEAFDCLEAAYVGREPWLPQIRFEPGFDNLKNDPRFRDLHRRLGLESALDTKSVKSRTETSQSEFNEKIMLAVLPLKNLSNDEEQEYFSDGMTEEMITRLGRLRPELLGVIARTSAMRYKDSDKSINQIGRELSVDYIIEGGVRRSGNSVRINAQLIEVSDQTQVWGESYTRELSDMFAVQTDVAESVAKSLAMELLPRGKTFRADHPPTESAAYDAYLLGRYYWAKRTPEALYKAIEHFERAIALDPGYARAYAGLSYTWGALPYYVAGPYNAMHDKADKAAARALALDDSLAESHLAMGLVRENQYDLRAADERFHRAVELDPNNATAHYWYGFTRCMLGFPDAGVAEFRKAILLDPVYAPVRWSFGQVLVDLLRFEEATKQLKMAIELQPGYLNAYRDLVWSYLLQERTDEAVAVFQEYLRLLGHSTEDVSEFIRRRSDSGVCDAITSWLRSLSEDDGTANLSAWDRAAYSAWCGDKGSALDLLNRARDQADPALNTLQTFPPFDSLHGDSRFQALLTELNEPRHGQEKQLP